MAGYFPPFLFDDWIMRVLFIHEGLGQFEKLHKHLNAQGLAHSWFLCSASAYAQHKDAVPNLVPFHVPKENPKSYFYTKNIETRTQRSFYLKQAIGELLKKTGLDLIVAHGSGGFPLQLFDEFDIPIVSYIEFPSFGAHGHDKKYPQPEYSRYVDKLFEMSSFHQVIKSELVIVPSAYAKSMYPVMLQDNIVPQMEGFDIVPKPSNFKKEPDCFYIGYTARDLSSAKGFEQFILIAKQILARTQKKVKFVFCGAPKVLYSYEEVFLNSQYSESDRPSSFMDYILRREGIELGKDPAFEHVSFSAYDDFASFIDGMDMFLYPLQYGSANWGLFEIVFRGKIVIGSDRCFIPEVIDSGRNGLLCQYDDIDYWTHSALKIIDSPVEYSYLGRNALRDANERFHISRVAPRYLDIFNSAIAKRKLRRLSL